MGDFVLNMDATQVAPNMGGGRNYFPVSDSKGWLCSIEDAEPRENSAKDGSHLLITLVGHEGPVQGLRHDIVNNYLNKSQKAVDIAKGEISAMAHCVGVLQVQKISQLYRLPFRVVVSLDTNNQEQYPGSTRIMKILSKDGLNPLEAMKAAATQGNAFQSAATTTPAANAFAAATPAAAAAFQPATGGAVASPAPTFQPAQAAAFQPAAAPTGGGFDPNTGAPIGQAAAPAPAPRFDPLTGQPLPDPNAPRFDPLTGQPFQPAGASVFAPTGAAS